MAKRMMTKRQSFTKHYTANCKLSNKNPTENGWTQVVRMKSSTCSTTGTRHDTIVMHPVVRYWQEKGEIVITTKETHSWSLVSIKNSAIFSFCVVFVRPLFVFCGYSIVCPLIYGSWLNLRCLQAFLCVNALH